MIDKQTERYLDRQLLLIAFGGWVAFCILLKEVRSMSSPNAAGHSAGGNNPDPIPGTAGTAFTVPAGVYKAVYESTAGVFIPCDGTESAQNKYAGFVGPGTYAIAGSLSVFPPTSQLPPLSTGIIGELYAATDGSLVITLAAAVPIGSWGMMVGKSLSNRVIVEDVLLEQRVV